MGWRYEVDHGPTDRLFDINGRVMPGVGEGSGENDVAIEDGSRGIGNRVLLIVAFGQYGIEGSN